MSTERIHAWTEQNRLLAADVLDGLRPDQWAAGTLCAGWTVRHLAAHLVQPMLVGFGRFFVTALRYRGDTDATVDHLTRLLARHRPAELVALLRQHAADRLNPPRVGPIGPFSDTCLHLRDIARPLGLDADVPPEHWVAVLDYLSSPRVVPALVPRGRLAGIALRATDADWRHGTGAEASGPLEALAMAATGRGAALDDLSGPGAKLLRRRL
ncbi:maleylpyruvate isomerase family mycothiol-dependent enzyme [Ornithinicoccus halotolerans]|uniref:maleylpyruvate isomerase family mycothiol-dependent enzyme n=1 Tax=Ornithinicoccus halotolerans TaxID=1748220 RepID=UPI00129753B4|nr:maleylpyruvate isomerase family mycothiol-dependent enzyme [Ornithinicoccus halotolerans]